MSAIDIPIATDDPEELADWVELDALFSEGKECSRTQLIRSLARTSTVEEVAELVAGDEERPGDPGSEKSQSVAGDAFDEIERRSNACGENYPFEVDKSGIRLVDDPTKSIYVFLLLLSKTAPTAGYDGTACLFEQLSRLAAEQYFGGAANLVRARRFGAPRAAPFAKLKEALDQLCKDLREGGGCKNADLAEHTGDAKLDIVAWRPFPDDRPGKLIGFGQCAAGRSDVEHKAVELDCLKFVKKWIREGLHVDPVRLLFVPWCVKWRDWHFMHIDGGIVFDRCRIAACSGKLDDDDFTRMTANIKKHLDEGPLYLDELKAEVEAEEEKKKKKAERAARRARASVKPRRTQSGNSSAGRGSRS